MWAQRVLGGLNQMRGLGSSSLPFRGVGKSLKEKMLPIPLYACDMGHITEDAGETFILGKVLVI